MKKFLINIILFFVFCGALYVIGLLLPATPSSKNNMLACKVQKDSLLQNVKEPRIIFVGGSNLVFGLNSQMVKDTLHLNPINTGMAINIGLIYMMDDVLPHVQKGDIVVLIPEYQLYFGRAAYGNSSLLRLLVDFERKSIAKLHLRHIPNLVLASPNLFLSKFKYSSYINADNQGHYSNKIFNAYGDSSYHWNLEGKDFSLLNPIKPSFNNKVLKAMTSFNERVKARGGQLMVSFPGCQESSYKVIADKTDVVYKKLQTTGISILGSPAKYVFNDTLMFDSPYHLVKKGVDMRTELLVKDIKKVIRYDD